VPELSAGKLNGQPLVLTTELTGLYIDTYAREFLI
jgi:hypothetical protein